jgi:hypothetical protein
MVLSKQRETTVLLLIFKEKIEYAGTNRNLCFCWVFGATSEQN